MLAIWWHYLPLLLRGTWVTAQVTALGLLVGVVLGAGVAALRMSRIGPLRWFGAGYVNIMRGIPVLVLLFFAYYGLGQEGIKLSSLWAPVAALGVFYAALFGETFRGGIQGIDPGQYEAGAALGMGSWLRFRSVIAPQAFLTILLPSTNTLSELLKDSSLVMLIGTADLMANSYNAAGGGGPAAFQYMDMFLEAGLIYFVLYLLISRVLARWEIHVQRRRS